MKSQRASKISQPQQKAAELDFTTPTPTSLKRKMVNWKDFLVQLMDEFPQANVGIVSPPLSLDELLSFRASSIIVKESRYQGVVYSRARQLERLAYFRNADIKFGFRGSKQGWQQAVA